ncbi:hypothetical protein SESBI_29558 [Sesbania bispinosa]|nr:hypothetical protein SESBI_29558 [Sesbania bispinosa]
MQLLSQSVVRPPPVRPSGMVMPVASRHFKEPIHTTPPPTSQPLARLGCPASMPPHTGRVFEDTFQAASRGVQQRFMQFMPTPRLNQNLPSNK